MKKKTLIVAAVAMLTLAMGFQMRTAQAANVVNTAAAEKQAEIQFDTLRIDMGTFSEKQGVQKCSFVFTNVGTAPLVINQAFASCGCTVPTYTKDPVKPGEKGTIDVTYNGKGKYPGRFSKSIVVRSNAKTEIVRLTIEGMMTE
ncbi:MAG: DUF1573 domain-containing protein [Bacteroidaceae bacterium]|nr:DUF1573 domain-containing protein [Bacteroidaceae bacterium]